MSRWLAVFLMALLLPHSALAIGDSFNATLEIFNTPVEEPPTEEPPITGGIPAPLVIENLYLVRESHRVLIFFSTNIAAEASLRWGETINYEGGYIAGKSLKKNHVIAVTGLQPETLYQAEVRATNPSGRTGTRTLQFVTTSEADITPPANVMNFKVRPTGDGARLTWDNPTDEDFLQVRIVSNDNFYPADPYDGFLVYQGDGSTVVDERPLQSGPRYYTAFTYDRDGNVSSGAVTAWYPPGYTPSQPSGTSTPYSDFDTSNVLFLQTDSVQQGILNILLRQAEITTVRIPYGALPEHLKTIMVTLTHPADRDQVFSFLLRINADKTAYEARIGSLPELGEYLTKIEVFDFKTSELLQLDGNVIVVDDSEESESEEVVVTTSTMSLWGWLWLIPIGLLLFLVSYVIRRLRFVPEDRSVSASLSRGTMDGKS